MIEDLKAALAKATPGPWPVDLVNDYEPAARESGRFKQEDVAYRTVQDLLVNVELSAVWKRGDRSPVRERFVTALRAVGRLRPKSSAT